MSHVGHRPCPRYVPQEEYLDDVDVYVYSYPAVWTVRPFSYVGHIRDDQRKRTQGWSGCTVHSTVRYLGGHQPYTTGSLDGPGLWVLC